MTNEASQSASVPDLEMKLRISDVSGQKAAYVPKIPADATVGELIEGLLPQMKLPQNDPSGRSLVYHARLEREGRHLNASEIVGDVVEIGDRITLQPNIDAGADR